MDLLKFAPQIVFILALAAGVGLFARNALKIVRNIRLGKPVNRTDNKAERMKTMLRVALRQGKMFTRPLAAVMHLFVYIGFVIINIEVIEIVLDGILGTHRILAFTGSFYSFLIASFEILAFLVILGCVVFFIRRNSGSVQRLLSKGDLSGWPSRDGNMILITEILLMTAFLSTNAADALLQSRGAAHYTLAGSFPISGLIQPLYEGLSTESLIAIERFGWWFHILGILAFANYLPYSKHLHIILAFPNTYFSRLTPKGQLTNLESVTKEVQLMLDPNADPFAPADPNAPIPSFGAKDVTDLSWKQLLDAYTCTECGRCSSVCPANQTGKLLSPRKIMMSTRDRLTDVGKWIDANGKDAKPENALLHDYISAEELWACTTCNACAEICPVNIDPVSIIIDLRRSLVMEESAAPAPLNTMFSNIENNAAPWQFSQADRLNWAQELN